MNNHFHIADRADRFIAIIRDDRSVVEDAYGSGISFADIVIKVY